MYKLLLLSVVIAMLVIPSRAARHSNPVSGFRRALLWMLAFNALYVAANASFIRLPI